MSREPQPDIDFWAERGYRFEISHRRYAVWFGSQKIGEGRGRGKFGNAKKALGLVDDHARKHRKSTTQ